MSNRRIIIAVTGSVAARKAPDIISALRKNNCDVQVIATEAALRFTTEMSLAIASGHTDKTFRLPNGKSVITSLWDDLDGSVTHVELARWLGEEGIFAVIPASANSIAKLAQGFGDNIVLATALALHVTPAQMTPGWPPGVHGGGPSWISARTGPTCIVAPAMNHWMWSNQAVQRNLKTLVSDGWQVIQPDAGLQACGDVGEGNLPPTKRIVEFLVESFPKVSA